MNIRDFRSRIDPVILHRGEVYLKSGKVQRITGFGGDGSVMFRVRGTSLYNVIVTVKPDGTISRTRCSCPYEYGGPCKHIAAVLMYIANIFDETTGANSSGDAGMLINAYRRKASAAAGAENNSAEDLHLVPLLKLQGDTLIYTLKFGGKKLFVVKDINELYNAFRSGSTLTYGKSAEITHSFSKLDKQSEELLLLSYTIFRESGYSSCNIKQFELNGMNLLRFFEIMKDTGISLEERFYEIQNTDPEVLMSINKTKSGNYSLKPSGNFMIFTAEPKMVFFDNDNGKIHLCSSKFTDTAAFFLKHTSGKRLIIPGSDIQQFYLSVLRPVSRYITVSGMEKLEEFAPPQFSAKLYLDADNQGCIFGALKFFYGEKEFTPPESRKSNPYCDYYAESACESLLNRYFSPVQLDDGDKVYCIDDEDGQYRLITEGLPLLKERMEIMATDRFSRKMVVRPAPKPAVGVRPSGLMLELEITAEGYSPEELREILAAYRPGKKYHKLRDGSFVTADESIGELLEITESLNLSDKALLKEKIKVPAFRMLYLDSLGNSAESVRINRSEDFLKQTESLRKMLNSPEDIKVPAALKGIMREYQVYGFRWMKTLSAYGLGGILADDMGLGKTLQAIALMLDEKQNGKSSNLVICPASLVLNWENEIRKFAPQLTVLTVTGTAAERSESIAKAGDYDVLVTSYSLVSRDFTEYEDCEFDCIFIDEAQYIKNSATQTAKAVKAINGKHRFALTGTPVENSFAELWSIFDFVMPGYLFSYKYFREHFELPVVRDGSKAAESSLQRIVSPFILRRMKKDVLTELPEKTETVMLSDMEEEQSRLYSAAVSSVKEEITVSSGNNTEKIKILAMLTRLRQICCDPSLIYENYTGKSGKLEQCMELVESCVESGHKILLFSQFTSMLEIIAKKLEDAGITYYTLTGSTKPAARIQLVDKFNTDDTNVFLISLKAGGTGLNLTGADVVIHYDPWWNSSAENQASDRAYRIGQDKNVQIYKLIARRTIEEKIRELQTAKSDLAEMVLSGGGNIMTMSADDIMKLLS